MADASDERPPGRGERGLGLDPPGRGLLVVPHGQREVLLRLVQDRLGLPKVVDSTQLPGRRSWL
jgi:hypothetical protein